MEKLNKVERSELWNEIYYIVKQIPRKAVYGDSVDPPTATTSIEEMLIKREETSKNNGTAQLGIGAISRRTTFEYRVIDHDMFDEDEIQTINSMGSKGWEIIRILEPMKWLNSDGMFVRIYYKREKQS